MYYSQLWTILLVQFSDFYVWLIFLTIANIHIHTSSHIHEQTYFFYQYRFPMYEVSTPICICKPLISFLKMFDCDALIPLKSKIFIFKSEILSSFLNEIINIKKLVKMQIFYHYTATIHYISFYSIALPLHYSITERCDFLFDLLNEMTHRITKGISNVKIFSV